MSWRARNPDNPDNPVFQVHIYAQDLFHKYAPKELLRPPPHFHHANHANHVRGTHPSKPNNSFKNKSHNRIPKRPNNQRNNPNNPNNPRLSPVVVKVGEEEGSENGESPEEDETAKKRDDSVLEHFHKNKKLKLSKVNGNGEENPNTNKNQRRSYSPIPRSLHNNLDNLNNPNNHSEMAHQTAHILAQFHDNPNNPNNSINTERLKLDRKNGGNMDSPVLNLTDHPNNVNNPRVSGQRSAEEEFRVQQMLGINPNHPANPANPDNPGARVKAKSKSQIKRAIPKGGGKKTITNCVSSRPTAPHPAAPASGEAAEGSENNPTANQRRVRVNNPGGRLFSSALRATVSPRAARSNLGAGNSNKPPFSSSSASSVAWKERAGGSRRGEHTRDNKLVQRDREREDGPIRKKHRSQRESEREEQKVDISVDLSSVSDSRVSLGVDRSRLSPPQHDDSASESYADDLFAQEQHKTPVAYKSYSPKTKTQQNQEFDFQA